MTGERGPDRLARDNLDVHYGPGSRASRTAGARTAPATGVSPAGRVRLGTYSTGVSRQKGDRSTYGPPESPAPRVPSLRPNSAAVPSSPSKEAPPAGRHKLDGSAGGPATRKQ